MERDAPGSEPAEVTLPPAPSDADRERAELLLRNARVAAQRGQKEIAEKLIDEALGLAPGSAEVQGALAESLVARKQLRKARDTYRLAMQLDPKNPEWERRYGELVLEIELPPDLRTLGGRSDAEVAASGKTAALLSVFVPGLGQIVTGQVAKGAAMLGLVVLGWVWATSVPNGLSGLGSLLGASRGNAAEFNGIVLLPLFIAIGTHIWAITDASARSKVLAKKTIERPKPPVDMEF